MLTVVLVAGAVGAALMLIFESPLARVAGMLALVVFMVGGLFVVADPEYLGEGERDEPPAPTRRGV
jgi:hypothetical protein